MKCKKIGSVLIVIIWLAQAAAEIFSAYQIIKLNILPDKIMFVAELIFLFLLTGTGLLFFRHSKKKPGRLRPIITGVLSLLVVAVCMIGSYTLFKLESTFSAVTDEKTLVTVPVGVYIKSDNSVETVKDSSNFTYAVIKSDTDFYTDQVVGDIEKEIGDSISTKTYDSLPEMADALENDEVQAIIVNDALVDVLSEIEEYKDFPSGVKQIYEDSVIRKEEAAVNNIDSNTLHDDSTTKSVSVEANDTKAANVEKRIGTDITNTPCYFSGSDTRDKMLTTRWNVNSYAVTGTGGRGETYSMPGWSLYVMYPDEDSVDTAKNLINQVIVGEMQEK